MKKLVALLLVVAFLFGFGCTLARAVGVETPMVADGPGIPPPLPPTQWPPENSDSIGSG